MLGSSCLNRYVNIAFLLEYSAGLGLGCRVCCLGSMSFPHMAISMDDRLEGEKRVFLLVVAVFAVCFKGNPSALGQYVNLIELSPADCCMQWTGPILYRFIYLRICHN